MNDKIEKKKKRTQKDWIDHVNESSNDWEPDGKYGNDPDHMEIGPSSVGNKKSDLRSIRIDDEFLKEIKEAAQDEGFDSYQAFIKVILKRYIKDRKKREA
ncbi:hypothetical protein [Oligoflexus tunisiensis]|uniref:hypothetical protein n=1 Tax=Oligoflexus tunisiensis TaxID=708132 RepID=UPI00114CFC0A|nr:hypothetical protein [Oligoflexus tunisiensis]